MKSHRVRTRALGQGHLHDLRGIIIWAGLGGAVTDSKPVVLLVAQAGHVVGLAAKLGSLGVHVGDAHLLAGISVRPSAQGWKRMKRTHSALRAGHAGGGDRTGSSQQGHSNGGKGLHCAGGKVFRRCG